MFYYFLVLPIFIELQFLLSAKIIIIFNNLGKLASTIGKTWGELKIYSIIGLIRELFGKYIESKQLFSIARKPKISTNNTTVNFSGGRETKGIWFFGFEKKEYFPSMKRPDSWRIIPNPFMKRPDSGITLVNPYELQEYNSESANNLLALDINKSSNSKKLNFTTKKLIAEASYSLSKHDAFFNTIDTDIRVLNSKGKPQNYSFDLMSYLENLAKKEYIENLVYNLNKDLQVFMDRRGVFSKRELPQTYDTPRE